jgi:hypothetical protein
MIRQKIGHYDDLLATVKKRKLEWYGHVTRRKEMAKTILQGTTRGGGKRGLQRKQLDDNIRKWTGMKLYDTMKLAERRD